MKRIARYVAYITITVFMISCSMGSYYANTVRTMDLAPGLVKLDLTMADFEYIGSVKVDVSYRTYLSGIMVYDTINHLPYDRRVTRTVHFTGDKGMYLSLPIQKATYKVVDTYPQADYYVPIYRDKQTEKMFLGSRTTESVIFKVYKQKK